MMNLRQAAEGQPCILCGSVGTTVLHHVRSGGNGGMGKKPPDEHGIEVCAEHHAYFHADGIADYRLALIAYQRQVSSWLKRGVFR